MIPLRVHPAQRPAEPRRHIPPHRGAVAMGSLLAFTLILPGLRILPEAGAAEARPASGSAITVSQATARPDAWFATPEGLTALSNVLSHQSARGDWPKNTKTAATRSSRAPAKISGTFDNGATTGELRLLARAQAAVADAGFQSALRAAFQRGLDHILGAQYTNGGWPQYAPPPAKSYHRHITLNDGTLVRLLEFTRDVGNDARFSFVDPARREASRRAYQRGIEALLRCQIVRDGRPTVWCAQHDEITLEPRPARAYELASFSGSESAGVLLFLMGVPNPSPGLVRAVHGGAAWFEQAAMTGWREVKVDGDKRLVADAQAPRLWARFYHLETGRPFYCGRDGVPQADFAAIEAERRNGYAWHGTWGEPVLKRFAEWSKQHPSPTPVR